MRLGQMARKLGVTQGEIVRYLTGKNIRVEEGGNVKLGEAQIRLLYAHFAPGEHFEDRPSPVQSASAVPAENSGSTPAESSAETTPFQEPQPASKPMLTAPLSITDIGDDPSVKSEQVADPTLQPAPTVPGPASTGQSETIRASKIELAGLKVIGKIELPGPRKKEVSEPLADDSAQQPIDETANAGLPQPQSDEVSLPLEVPKGVDRPRRRSEGRRQSDERSPRRNQGRDQRPGNNPIAAQREREQQQELERRKEKAAQDKERRTQNYNNRVRHSPPTKAVRLIEDPVEQYSEDTLDEQPKTWFGRLIKWLGL